MKEQKIMKKVSILLIAAFSLGTWVYSSSTFASTKITYMVAGGSPFSEAVLKLLPEFEKESGIKVEVVELPYEQTYSKGIIEARNRTGAYDVIQINRPALAAYSEADLLVPLEKYVSKQIIDDMFAAHGRYVTFDDKVYAVPHSNDIRALYYRTDLYREAGIAGPPTNWKQMEEIALKLTDPQKKQYGLLLAGSSKGPGVWVLADFIYQAGGSILDETRKPVVNSPQALKGLSFFVKLLREDNVLPAGAINYLWMDVRTLFAQGNFAMVQEFNDIIPLLDDPKTSRVRGKYDLALIPGEVRQGTNNAGWLVAIPQGCRNPVEAGKLIDFIMSIRGQMEMCLVSGTLSARKSVLDSLIAKGTPGLPKGDVHGKSRWEFYKKVIATTYELPRVTEEPEIETILGVALSQALAGIKSPQEALDEAQQEIEKILR